MYEQIKMYCLIGIMVVLLLFIVISCLVIKLYRKEKEDALEEMKKQRPINSIGWGKRVRGPEYKNTPKESVFATIKRIILEKMDVLEEDIQGDTNLHTLSINCPSLMEVILAIETEFMIYIPGHRTKALTINNLVQICTEKLAEPTAKMDSQK